MFHLKYTINYYNGLYLIKTENSYMPYTAVLLTIICFGFCGCSNKATPEPSEQTNNTSSDTHDVNHKIEENSEAIEDEFEDEFETQKIDNDFDPLSRYNRSMTHFNDKMITYALNPVSEAYAYIIPQPLRIGLSNFIKNINFPVRLTNNLLQGKFQNVSDEVERFIVNSTVGLAGLMDPAQTYMHIPEHKEDFGQTLGYYGVGSGFHIVLPFLGPSNLRDLAGVTLDAYVSPLVNVRSLENYKIPQNLEQSLGIVALQMINRTSLHLGQYESIKKDAIDLYPFLKDIYEQKRMSDINE